MQNEIEAAQPAQTTDSPAVASAATCSGLWSVHITGMDEYHAKRTKTDAEKDAQAFNEWYAARPHDEYTPEMRATVQEWPFSAESHAKDMNDRTEARGTERAI